MLKQVIDVLEILDSPSVRGCDIERLFKNYDGVSVEVETIGTEKGSTDVVRVLVKGKDSLAPVIGIMGQLGGIGARPERLGLVSDGDGAAAALSTALKAANMRRQGDILPGDLFVATHICPDAPTQPHEPVPFMGSPVGTRQVIQAMKRGKFDALISLDTTKGNRILNWKGIAITPTVKEGYILKVSQDLLDIYERVTGTPARVLPITMQDISPYGNEIYHINSIMQPCTQTTVPVVGLAVTTEVTVPGCATGASSEGDIELAARFSLEVAKEFGAQKCDFYDRSEFEKFKKLYKKISELVYSTEGLKND